MRPRWMYGISLKLFLVCFVFVLSSVTIISTLSYYYIQNEIRSSQLDKTNLTLQKMEQYLELYYQLVQNSIMMISTSVDFSTGDIEVAQKQLINLHETNSLYLNNIYIILPDLSIIGGNPVTKVFNDPLPERKALWEQAMSSPNIIHASGPYQSTYSGRTVTITRLFKWGNDAAVIASDLNLQALEDRLLQISRNDDLNFGILDRSGQVIATGTADKTTFGSDNDPSATGELSAKQLVFEKDDVFYAKVNDNPVTVTKKIVPQLDWTIFSIMDESRLAKALDKIKAYFVGLLGIGLLLSACTAVLVARFIRNPVNYLIRKMSLAKNGDLQITVLNNRKDEFGELAATFEEMLTQIRKLIANLNESERLKREMQLQVLQSQINPHFLYNTLGTISNVVDLGKTELIDPLIASLISILEYGISDVSEKVTLQEELDNIRDYLFIQEVRYSKRFELKERIEPDMYRYPVLKMMLQPIIENCFFHGYAGGRLEGAITLNGYWKNGRLLIEVIDEGVGIPEEKLSVLLAPSTESPVHRQRKRIGLYNIHKRIQLLYGESYGLEIQSESGKGTCVRLCFPDDRNVSRARAR